jgi:hypothetical protein
MKAQIDKLFRDRLEQHSLEAPPLAWDKIESALPKKTKSFIWFKVAASLLVLIAAAILLWPHEKSTPTVIAHNKPIEKNLNNKAKDQEKIDTQTQKNKNIIEKKEVKTETTKATQSTGKPAQQKTTLPVMNFSKQEPLIAANDQGDVQHKTDAVEPKTQAVVNAQEVFTAPAETSVPANPDQVSNTLVLAASDVSKYLNKNLISDATTVEENTSSFRKLLDKASDLKNSETGLSELRQKKNEILALNFRNDKRERNN